MSKKAGIAFIITGAVLMISALLLWYSNVAEDNRAAEEAGNVMEIIRPIITDKVEEEKELSPEMPVVKIGSYGYIGYLKIEAIDLELPVIDSWSYTKLETAPCRHFGSSRTDDLVIAGHDYKAHFKYLYKIPIGSEAVFTDMENIQNRYVLEKISKVKPEDVEAVQNSGYDLVLYTCTPGGKTRTVGFFNRIQQD